MRMSLRDTPDRVRRREASSAAKQEEHEKKPMDAESRFKRLQERRATEELPTLGKRVDAPTPFGMTGLSRQAYSSTDPQITSRAKDFPKEATKTGASYDSWEGQISDWKGLKDAVDTGVMPSRFPQKEQRAAAMMYATTQRAEPYRQPGADKIARSALRKKAGPSSTGEIAEPSSTGEKATTSSTSFSHLFPMAAKRGAHAYDKLDDLTSSQKKVIEDMSDSSGDE